MNSYMVYVLDGAVWKMVRHTENLQVALDLCKSNQQNGYLANVETALGHHVYGNK